MLEVKNLHVSYGMIDAVKGIDFQVNDGEIVSLIGANGAGKTTTMHTLSGLLKAKEGTILLDGKDLTKVKANKIVGMGLVQVPEGRRVFTQMSVEENLQLGAYLRHDKSEIAKDFRHVYELFPRLEERKKQLAGTLSGGEQQMVAVARAIIGMPKLLILDEPSLGLAPNIVDDILNVAKTMAKESGISVLLVEQDITKALATADRGYVVENGHVALQGTAAELSVNEHVKKAYLGI